MQKTLCLLLFLPALALAKPPNMLVILVDDLGYGDLSAMGATDLRTPHIDGIFARGMRFDNFYANCPVCSPTRASLVTGRFPDLVGVPGVIRTHPQDNWGWLTPGVPTLPGTLREAGYETALVGKWHLGLDEDGHPNNRGFDHFHGFLGDMMDDYYHHRRHGQDYMRLNREKILPEGHATDLFSRWATDYLERQQQRKDDRPWFLYLAYNAPHTPIQPPADWLEKVRKREPDMTPVRAKLVALIEHLDHGVGQVLASLEATGQADNTLVVFTSDNGGQCNVGGNNGDLRGCKQDMYEGGIRATTAFAWPGHIEAGSRSGAIGVTMDLYPTLAQIAGTPAPEGLDGISLLPVLTGEADKTPGRDLFWVRREGNLRYMGESTWAMRSGPWKLVKNSPSAPWEMYNLADDPAETTDLSQRNRKQFNALAGRMRKHIQRGGAVPWQRP